MSPLTPPPAGGFRPDDLAGRVLGSPAQYPRELDSYIAKRFSKNKLLKVDWNQLPGPKISSSLSSSAPKQPQNGDLWWQIDTALLKRWNGSAWVTTRGDATASPGYEFGYDQITAAVNVTGLAAATPTTIISGSTYTFDGSPVWAEFWTPQAITPSAAAGASISVGFYDAAASTTLIAFDSFVTPAAANAKAPFRLRFKFTPTAGNHAYMIRAWVSSTTGTPSIQAGSGSGGNQPPAYLSFTKV